MFLVEEAKKFADSTFQCRSQLSALEFKFTLRRTIHSSLATLAVGVEKIYVNGRVKRFFPHGEKKDFGC